MAPLEVHQGKYIILNVICSLKKIADKSDLYQIIVIDCFLNFATRRKSLSRIQIVL